MLSCCKCLTWAGVEPLVEHQGQLYCLSCKPKGGEYELNVMQSKQLNPRGSTQEGEGQVGAPLSFLERHSGIHYKEGIES